MSRDRFVMFSVTGYPNRLPYPRIGTLRRKQKPSTIYYVADRLYCWRVISEHHSELLARRALWALNAGLRFRTYRFRIVPRVRPKTWHYDRGRKRWLRV